MISNATSPSPLPAAAPAPPLPGCMAIPEEACAGTATQEGAPPAEGEADAEEDELYDESIFEAAAADTAAAVVKNPKKARLAEPDWSAEADVEAARKAKKAKNADAQAAAAGDGAAAGVEAAGTAKKAKKAVPDAAAAGNALAAEGVETAAAGDGAAAGAETARKAKRAKKVAPEWSEGGAAVAAAAGDDALAAEGGEAAAAGDSAAADAETAKKTKKAKKAMPDWSEEAGADDAAADDALAAEGVEASKAKKKKKKAPVADDAEWGDDAAEDGGGCAEEQAAPKAEPPKKVKIKKAITDRIKLINEELSAPLRLGAVAGPLSAVDQDTALAILDGVLTEGGDADPTLWVVTAAKAAAKEAEKWAKWEKEEWEKWEKKEQEQTEEWFGKLPEDLLEAIRDLNHRGVLAEPLRPTRVAGPLSLVPISEAKAILKQLEMKHAETSISHPNGWVSIGAKKRASPVMNKVDDLNHGQAGRMDLLSPINAPEVREPLSMISAKDGLQILKELEAKACDVENTTKYILERCERKIGPIGQKLKWLNENAKVMNQIRYAEALAALGRVPEKTAMAILTIFERRADRIRSPSHWMKAEVDRFLQMEETRQAKAKGKGKGAAGPGKNGVKGKGKAGTAGKAGKAEGDQVEDGGGPEEMTAWEKQLAAAGHSKSWDWEEEDDDAPAAALAKPTVSTAASRGTPAAAAAAAASDDDGDYADGEDD